MNTEKSLTTNFIFNFLYSVLKILFPIITVPYLSRVLQPEGIGKVSYANNIVAWFILFASLGIPRYGVREIAKYKNNDDEMNITFSNLFLINFISTIITTALYLILINLLNDSKTLYLAVGIQLVLNIFNVDWLYQGIEEFEYITKRSFIIKVISLFSIYIFVKNYQDYIIYALIQSFAVAGNNILNFINLHKYTKFRFDKIEIRKHILPIIVLLSTQLAINVYALLDTTMLGYRCSVKVKFFASRQIQRRSLAALTTFSRKRF